MSPFMMILLILLVAYFVTKKKRTAEEQEPPHQPMQVTLEQGCWSCTPEELLEDLGEAVRRSRCMALPVYVYGQGYEVRDLRHWVTLLTEPDGRLSEAVLSWPADAEQTVRQSAACYVNSVLDVLAAGESKAIFQALCDLISQHKAGQRDELVKLSAMSRVAVLLVDEPKPLVTVRITPVLPEELTREQTEAEASDRDTASNGAEPCESGDHPAGEAEDAKE